MKSFLRATSTLLFISVMAGCGGGGGESSEGSNATTKDKYSGTHSYCDGDHTRYKVTFNATGKGNYSISETEATYQNSNCTGNILATYSESAPSTLSFIATGLTPVNAPGLASSLIVDKYKLNIPQKTATLTGSGVNGSCVNYPQGRFCYDLTITAEQIDIGFYSTAAGFYPLLLENGTYQSDSENLYVKE